MAAKAKFVFASTPHVALVRIENPPQDDCGCDDLREMEKMAVAEVRREFSPFTHDPVILIA